jgi:TonB family protein
MGMRLVSISLTATAGLLALALGALAADPPDFVPARYRSGALPAVQVRAVGGGEVYLDVKVDATGAVTRVSVLRATPPFTDPVVDAVRGWQFAPAEDSLDDRSGSLVITERRQAVESDVFVAAVFRPPTINTPTLGEGPRDIGSPAEGSPFPQSTVPPLYPANALFDGVALIEADVKVDGQLGAARVLRSAPPFDDAALQAMRGWTFRPARVRGRLVPSAAYVVFAFRQPVTTQ